MTEPQTVEALISYAGHAFYNAGIPYRGGRMARLIRSIGSTQRARHIIDTYLADQIEAKSWQGFELYAHSGYADPTGATAARNVDLRRNNR
ncbi:hypothetical protein [Microbacterium sp. NPDC089188]|uniref:hypothetical protein n=1 Tax=Microbacterium sp. NPDC089188 TaxID=3154971 RepID=UPI00342EEE85